MNLESLKSLLHGSLPFTLRMVSGRVIEIPHPDFVALSPDGGFIVFIRDNGRIESIRLNQIESFEAPEQSASA